MTFVMRLSFGSPTPYEPRQATISEVNEFTPVPDFVDVYKTHQVFEAAIVSAQEKRSVKVAEMK